MAVTVPNCGTYMVEMDYGATTNAFVLDDPVKGVIGSTTYLIEGSPLYVDVTSYVKSVSIAGNCVVKPFLSLVRYTFFWKAKEYSSTISNPHHSQNFFISS